MDCVYLFPVCVSVSGLPVPNKWLCSVFIEQYRKHYEERYGGMLLTEILNSFIKENFLYWSQVTQNNTQTENRRR